MKTSFNIQKITNLLRAILVLSIIMAVLIAGYNIAIGNFHEYFNL